MAEHSPTEGIKIPSSGDTTPEYNAVRKSYEDINPAIIPDDFVSRAHSCGLIPTRNLSSQPLDVVLKEISRDPVNYYSLQYVVATLNVGNRFDKGIGKMEKTFQLEMKKYIPAGSSKVPKVEPDNCPKVFISYSRTKVYGDSPDTYTEAKDLYTRLETQGCNPWMDERGLEYGDILAEEIFWAIKQCDFIIFIMTSGYATSLWCLRELYYATLQEDRKKIMIGMLLEDDAVITNQKAGEWLLRMGTGQRYFKPTEDEKAAMVKLLKDKMVKKQKKLPHPSKFNEIVSDGFSAKSKSVLHSDKVKDFRFLIKQDLKELKKKFITLQFEVRESVSKRVPPQRIVAHVLSDYEDIYENNDCKPTSLFSDADQEKLNSAISVDHVFQILRGYWSFLKCEILYSIVEHFGDELDQARVKEYQKQLETFFNKRKVSEVPEELMPSSSIDVLMRDKMLIKLDKENPPWTTITDLEFKICEILGIMPSVLLIIGVQEGCVEITFSIPKHISQQIFRKPLTKEQQEQFRATSILRLSCGNVHLTIEERKHTPSREEIDTRPHNTTECDASEDLEHQLAAIDNTQLNEDDWKEVCRSVDGLSARWRELARHLGLDANSIHTIAHENPLSMNECLSQVLIYWLRCKCNIRRNGHPSWRTLAKAVKPLSGLLFNDIKKAHPKSETPRASSPLASSRAPGSLRGESGNGASSPSAPHLTQEPATFRASSPPRPIQKTAGYSPKSLVVVISLVIAGVAVAMSLGFTGYHNYVILITKISWRGTGDKASFRNFPHMNERPTMNQLAILERGDGGNPVRISERIGVKYSVVGTYLLKDDHGVKMETVTDNARGNVDSINREILRRWLAGSGAPVSWKVLVDTLERAQLIALANDIVDALDT